MRPAPTPMTADEFLAWAEGREGRWEFVDGVAIDISQTEAMAGAKRAHDIVTGNLFAALHAALKGGPCRAYTGDFAVRTQAQKAVRRPDVLVDCSAGALDDLAAAAPTAAFEVLSASTATVTRFVKVEEYKALPTMRHVVILEPRAPKLVVYTRAANDAWMLHEADGLDATLALPALGVELPLRALYDGVGLAEGTST